MQKKLRGIFCILLVVVLTATMFSTDTISALAKVTVNGYTDPGDNDVVKIVSNKSYDLVPGVTENDIVLNDQTGDAQVMAYMTSISPEADVTLKATYTGYYSNYNKNTQTSTWEVGDWGLSTTTEQAAAYEEATGENVIFATNGDYFNMQTGQPIGTLFLNGVDCNPDKTSAEPFFAVLKDGSYVIRNKGAKTSDVLEAVGSPFYLVKNGKNVCDPGMNTLYPVNSVGFKADGTLVFFMADGRQYPKSVGMTQYEMAEFLVAQGVVTALYLDGGGSATVVTQREGESELEVRNSPSDGGERSISSGFLLIANATSDGVFDHASVTPNSESFTPGSTVSFEASGVDAAGGSAELPTEGLTWKLSSDSSNMGTLDENSGEFVSNGKTGEAAVELLYNENTVGQTSIYIAEPDSLSFSSASASLDFGEESDLGLQVRANNADLNYKDGDFTWTFSDDLLGRMDGNTFVAASATSTLKGTVTVSYERTDGQILSAEIAVEIGKMPVVSFDFEAVDGVKQTAAHYHWGKWAPGYTGNVSPITVCTANQYKANPTYAQLTAPYVFTGNYESKVPASDIFRANGYSYYLWPNATITQQNVGSLTTITADEGGQVRFGEYSLELNYDYKSYDGSKNANYYVRYCGEPYYIEGQPNQLGVWVYADASSKGYMLYADIAVWNGSTYTTKNLPLVHGDSDSAVIDWEGWMYCKADMSGLTGYYSEEHPYAILPGYGLFWLSYQPAKQGTNRSAGTIYFDNYRFVYGTDLDDLDSPEVTSILVNSTETESDENVQVYSSDVEITANYYDPTGDNASGINASMTEFKVDNEVVSCDSDESSATTRLSLTNGLHSIQVTAYDCFGNSSTLTRYFVVSDESDTATATLSGPDVVTMGSDYKLSLTTTGTVSSIDMSVVQVNSDFGTPEVTFAEGWTGEAVYTETGFKKAKIDIKAEWNGEGEAPSDAEVLTLSFNVPSDLDPEMDFFTYQVTSVKCTLPDGTVTTGAQPKVSLSLSAYYTVTADIAIAGYDTTLTVTNPDGNDATNVSVYINDSLIGTTDENGQIVTDVSETMTAGSKFTVYAKDDNYTSFTLTVTVMADAGYSEDAKPVGVALQASEDGATMQTISWMSQTSSSEAKAVVEYSTNADLENAITVEGKSTLHAFSTTKSAARINSVEITGLTPGSTYYYKVGDGKTWSEVKTFTTDDNDNTTKFFVVGDTQMNGNTTTDANEIALLESIASNVEGYDFGLQTGDYIDNGGNYSMWEEMQNVFGEYFSATDIIHTYGNHEYYGDTDGTAASLLFNKTGKDTQYYSVEYGNVYVAVINYGATLSEALDWLVEDAKASDATWKILAVHQPPYYTNVNGGSERFNAMIPKVVDEAGIDAVFSGHDHSYARTNPMTAGEIDEEEGAVYFICGDLGEKSRNVNYAATNTESFNFASISQDYSALYITVEATDDELSFKSCDADGTVIDSYTMEKYNPCEEGHTWSTYNRETGMLKCSVCGLEELATEALYSGWAMDTETQTMMYFVSGKYSKGYVRVENKGYYFDNDGLLTYTGLFSTGGYLYYSEEGIVQTGLVEINGKYFFFDSNKCRAQEGTITVTVDESNGLLTEDKEFTFTLDKQLVEESDGRKYYYVEGCKTYGGLILIDNDVYYINSKGYAATGHVYVSKTNKLLDAGYYDFDDEGIMLNMLNGICEVDGVKYYYKMNEKYYAGLIQIDGDYYYANSEGRIVTGRYKIHKTNDLLPEAKYDFDEDGKMITITAKNGLVEEDGVKYYYVDNKKTRAGLIEIDGYYYYINSDCAAVTGSYYISKTNDIMSAGRYDFDSEGRMYTGNNEIVNIDGTLCYLVNNQRNNAGVVLVGDNYYFAGSKGVIAVSKKVHVESEKTNGLIEAGTYKADENGKLDVPVVLTETVEETLETTETVEDATETTETVEETLETTETAEEIVEETESAEEITETVEEVTETIETFEDVTETVEEIAEETESAEE